MKHPVDQNLEADTPAKSRSHHLIIAILCVIFALILSSCLVILFVSARAHAPEGSAEITENPPADTITCATGKTIPIELGDTEAPVITMNGEAIIYLAVGAGYEDAGATVTDDCDQLELRVENNVDTAVAGNYTVTYSAIDSYDNIATATRSVYVVDYSHGGVVYLTFDDGPSDHTNRLLDTLAHYGVKATFFVTGSGDDACIARAYNEGHAIALHTYVHSYPYVYASADNFFSDLYRIQTRVRDITGYDSYLMRFPGGSSNTVSRRYDGGTRIMSYLVREVGNRGFTYFDWNVSSGDAGGATTADQVYNNVISQLKVGGSSVVLQHDTRGFSVDAVGRIIEYGLSHGFTFAKLDASSPTAHHGVAN